MASGFSRTRLWRVRKDHTWIDAQLSDSKNAVEVHFLLDGEPFLTREFPSRATATADAERTLRDLQRAGWNTHW